MAWEVTLPLEFPKYELFIKELQENINWLPQILIFNIYIHVQKNILGFVWKINCRITKFKTQIYDKPDSGDKKGGP